MIAARIICTTVFLFLASVSTAQEHHERRWEAGVHPVSLQGDFALLPIFSSEVHTLTYSASVATNVDFLTMRSVWGSIGVGIHAGASVFRWPNVYKPEKFTFAHGYSAVDYDFLIRSTLLSSRLRVDGLVGMTVRHGTYSWNSGAKWDIRGGGYDDWNGVGLKLGSAITFMVIRPVFALRLKGSMFLFGYKPIEAGAMGLGMVLGWQHDPWTD